MNAYEVVGAGIGLAWLLGPVSAALPHVLAYLWEALLNLVVSRYTFNTDDTTSLVLNGFLRSAEVIWEGHVQDAGGFEIFNVFVTPLKKRRNVWFEHTKNRWKLLKYKGVFILFLPQINGTGEARFRHPVLIYRRGALDIFKLLRECEDAHAETAVDVETKRFKIVDVYAAEKFSLKDFQRSTAKSDPPPSDDAGTTIAMPVTWKPEDIGVDVEAAETEDLATNPAMETIFRAVRFWYRKAEWYRERGLPHRIGVGAFGPPGTGKTSAIRAIASELDLPVYRYHLAGMTDREFSEKWHGARDNEKGPRIALFEDFDTVFEGREPVAGVEITYSDFLNTIDGVERDEGVLLYVTANDPNKIDSALGVLNAEKRSTRPGRLSVVVEFPGDMDSAGRHKIAARIMRGEDPVTINLTVAAGADDSPDQFTHRCIEKMKEVMMTALEKEVA